MGQQQLLLIVLGTIIVGLAVAIGITMYRSSAVDQNRTAVWNDLNHLGSKAQAYFRRPTTFGGGGKSFIGFKLYDTESHNDNGSYTVVGSPTDNQVVIQAKGVEIGLDGKDSVQLVMVIQPDTMFVNHSLGFN